jgi:hypothetical protein
MQVKWQQSIVLFLVDCIQLIKEHSSIDFALLKAKKS